MNKGAQQFYSKVIIGGIKLPPHEIDVFSLILQHMFEKYTQNIAFINQNFLLAGERFLDVVDFTKKRAAVLNLMEHVEGARVPRNEAADSGKLIINTCAFDEDTVALVRRGCESFMRTSQSESHISIARALKCRLTPTQQPA